MITIKEVITNKDKKLFARLPLKLFKNIDAFTPALEMDELAVFDKRKNPLLKDFITVQYLCYKNNELVGRIAGIINTYYNDKFNTKIARINRIDFIDDYEVSACLINQIEQWALDNNMNKVIGPMGFSDFDKMGLLVKGFEYDNTFITIWNPPYYEKHLLKLGYQEEVRWLESRIIINEIPDKISKAASIARKRYGFKLIIPKTKKEAKELAYPAFEMYNEAFSKLYGFHPMTKELMKYYIDQMMLIITLDYLWFVKDENDEIIGLGLMMPSLSQAMKKSNGKLLPLGLFRIFKSLKKHSVVDLYFIAVSEKDRNKGVPALMIEDGLKKLIKKGVKWAETGPELSTNYHVQAIWKEFETVEHRNRISMYKDLIIKK